MDNIGGAERVVLTLARELKADVYSTVTDQAMIKKLGFDIEVKRIGWVPRNAPFRQQIALMRFRALNIEEKYDYFIIAGDWAVSGAVRHKPNFWYVHSPIREIWDLYDYTRKNTVPFWARSAFDVWVKYNRYLNRKYMRHVQTLVCNSVNTQNRVKKYVQKEAVIINPPIETSKYYYQSTGNYWLSVNRLISHKRIDMQIKAFSRLPEEKLIIVGSYEQSRHFKAYARYIKGIKPENVEIVSWVDFNQLIEFYANCKGFITTAFHEDFGMTAVEAMASGKPVIAPNEGGYKETVIHGVTGMLIDEINVEKLIEAVKEVGRNPEGYKVACLKQAKKFDTEVFVQKIKQVIRNSREDC